MASPSRHNRHHSWPPIFHLVDHKKEKPLPDIDEDPFAHFITPVEEEDDPFETAFSAGILDAPADHISKAGKICRKIASGWTKYVANHHTMLCEQYHRQAPDIQPYETVIHEPSRGRADLRRSNRPRTSRTLSGHRHAWREPSDNIFTVMEEAEEQVQGLGKEDRLLQVSNGQAVERAKL